MTNTDTEPRGSQKLAHGIAGLIVFASLALLSVVNYCLFHALAELLGIVLACCIFLMAWNARRIMEDSFVVFVGIAYLFVALLDLMHVLGLQGMNLLPGCTADASAQFWVAARAVESMSLVMAPAFIGRRVRTRLLIGSYTAVFVLLALFTLRGHVLPLALHAQGANTTRRLAEAGVCLVFLAAAFNLHRVRDRLDDAVYTLLFYAVLMSIVAEISLVAHVDGYGISNLAGHFFKIISFYLVYKAIVEVGLRQPYNLLFRDMKRRQDMILESERRYRGIVEDQTELICRFKADGTLTFVNDAYCDYFGKTRKELIGRKFMPMVPEEDQDRVRAVIASLDRDTPVATIEHRIIAPDGSIRWQQWINRIIFEDDRQTVEYQGVGRDITARKQSEEAVQESERWRAVGALAGGVANSFNRIVRIISGSASAISDSVIPETRAYTEAQRILEVTRRAEELTRRLMTAAAAGRPGAPVHIQPVPLRTVIQDAVDLADRRLKEKHVEIHVTELEHMPYVRADSEQLLEILVGLLLNAADAMPEGGTVFIECTHRRIRRVSARVNPQAGPGNYVILSVRDTGAGMTRETLAHIFDPGFTTRQDGFAFGLGLSVARRMIQEFKGWITVRSRPGAGSTFFIFLPRAAAPAPTSPGKAPGRQTILFVDNRTEVLTQAKD
ncbi:MAG: PAS domain S-box protein, partial [Lentisphaerae bacterium]|nr:PAS domain S-box protein [Lentisphaerota bacterium]